MIYGNFPSGTNLPYVQVGLVMGATIMQLPFILDTGFSGDLKIDKTTAIDFGIVVSHKIRFVNANGEQLLVDASQSFVEMEGRRASIRIIIANGPPLAGSGLFSVFGYTVVVNYKNKTAYLEHA